MLQSGAFNVADLPQTDMARGLLLLRQVKHVMLKRFDPQEARLDLVSAAGAEKCLK